MVDVEVKTRTLNLDEIPEVLTVRKNLIMHLHDIGLSNNEIADYLNRKGIKKPRGKSYRNKDIWISVKKWKLRQNRLKDTEISIQSVLPIVLFN